MRDGVRQATGSAGTPIYHFDKADVDRLARLRLPRLRHRGGVRYTRDFADRRRVTDDAKQMNRLYAVESSPTLTGMKAEHRLPMRAVRHRGFARKLAAAVGRRGAGARSEHADAWRRAGREVDRAPSPRICRRTAAVRWSLPATIQPAAVHALAHAMNQALGNIGTTVTYGPSIEAAPDQSATRRSPSWRPRWTRVRSSCCVILGQQSGLHGAGGPEIRREARARCAGRLSRPVSGRDRGSRHWNIPDTHPLESWGDPRAYDGTVTIMQPLIAPLYDARSAHEVLATLTAQPGRKRSRS